MENKDRLNLAELLRQAASQTISEERFWVEAQDVTQRVDEPIVKLAVSSANQYFQLFHNPKKRFLLKTTKPDPAQVRQARDELNLIAAVLETGWQLPELTDIDLAG